MKYLILLALLTSCQTKKPSVLDYEVKWESLVFDPQGTVSPWDPPYDQIDNKKEYKVSPEWDCLVTTRNIVEKEGHLAATGIVRCKHSSGFKVFTNTLCSIVNAPLDPDDWSNDSSARIGFDAEDGSWKKVLLRCSFVKKEKL